MEKKGENKIRVDFLNRLKYVQDLRIENRLYSVMAMMRENLRYQFVKTQEIFRAAFDDSSGAEYWQCWFDKPGLTIETFARLIATHKSAEYADNISQNKSPSPMEMFSANREKIILTLREAAEMESLTFKGELDALLRIRRSIEVFLGIVWVDGSQGYSRIKTLSQVKIYPRQAINWFMESRERADLLPDSLRSWWANQSAVDYKGQIKQTEESESEIKETRIPEFVNKGDYYKVVFDRKTVLLKKTKGLVMIEYLVSRPMEVFRPKELWQLFSNPVEISPERVDDGYAEESSAQQMIDPKTIKAVEERLQELDGNSLVDPEKYLEEKEQLKQYLSVAKNNKRGSRSFRDNKENIRSAIDKNIRRTIKKMKYNSPDLHQHLTQTILTIKSPRWSYRPT